MDTSPTPVPTAPETLATEIDIDEPDWEATDWVISEALPFDATSPDIRWNPRVVYARAHPIEMSELNTVEPDPNDLTNRAEMFRLRQSSTPRRSGNQERYVTIDAEYFLFSRNFLPKKAEASTGRGDTIAYLEETWDQRQMVEQLTWPQVQTVIQTLGHGEQRRDQIDWPRELAWAFLSVEWHFLYYDVVEINPPLTMEQMKIPANGCNRCNISNARYQTEHLHA